MKKKIFFAFVFIFMMLSVNSANALEGEETTTQAQCTSKEKVAMNKKAALVKAEYDVEKQLDGSYLFTMKIYNIVDGLNIQLVATKDEKDATQELFGTNILMIGPGDTENGVYTFTSTDADNAITYNITIYGTGICASNIKKIKLVKPLKNYYHDYEECKFSSTEKSRYCQEWITKRFDMTESEVLKKIEEAKNTAQTVTTTKCANCDNAIRNEALNQRKHLLKIGIIVVLSIGVIINMFYIYLKLDAARRNSL